MATRRPLPKPSFAGLQNRNVVVDARRTSMRLEPEMWDALHDIAMREGATVNDICTRVERARVDSSLSSAMRVTILSYFRFLALAPDLAGSVLAAVLNEDAEASSAAASPPSAHVAASHAPAPGGFAQARAAGRRLDA